MSTTNTEPKRALLEEQPLVRPETIVAPEKSEQAGFEQKVEGEKKSTFQETIQKVGELMPLKRRPKPVLPQVRDPVMIKVEKILEDGLGDAYSRLSPVAQQEFKLRGEETALKISELMKDAHVKVKKVFQLIWEWLKMLPGINKFFLEQEAKIKTDRIIAIHNKEIGK